MIVFDASVLVSAAMGRGSVPDRAVRHAFASDRVAVSEPVMAEYLGDAVALRQRLAGLDANAGDAATLLWINIALLPPLIASGAMFH